MTHPLSKRKSPTLQDRPAGPSAVALPAAILPYPQHHLIPVIYHYIPTSSPPSAGAISNASLADRNSSTGSQPSHFANEYSYISPQLLPQPILTTGSPNADEREQARRVSHSAIEKRRRERINDKIMQLKRLIPSCADQSSLHKMSILQSAIDYITYLKEVVQNLDNGDNDQVCGRHLHVQTVRSMLPKEVEPFTSQFSIKKQKVVERRPTLSKKKSSSLPQSNSNNKMAALNLDPDDASPADNNNIAVTSPHPKTVTKTVTKTFAKEDHGDGDNKTDISSLSPNVQRNLGENMSLKNLLC